MSYVTIYEIQANGDVLEIAEGSNNHVFAPLIWDYLREKYGYDGGSGKYSDDRYNAMWKAWPDPKMPRLEQVLLGATFDRVWIKRETLPALIEACEWFLREHIKKPHKRLDYKTNQMVDSFYDDRALAGDPAEMMGFDGKMVKTRGNIGIIAALKKIYENPEARGAAFNCCSAVSSFWHIYDVPHTGQNEDGSIVQLKDEGCGPHVKDDECEICGVWCGEPCEHCGARSFHKVECSEYEWDSRPWNIDRDRDKEQPRGEYKGKSAWELTEELDRKPEVSP